MLLELLFQHLVQHAIQRDLAASTMGKHLGLCISNLSISPWEGNPGHRVCGQEWGVLYRRVDRRLDVGWAGQREGGIERRPGGEEGRSRLGREQHQW